MTEHRVKKCLGNKTKQGVPIVWTVPAQSPSSLHLNSFHYNVTTVTPKVKNEECKNQRETIKNQWAHLQRSIAIFRLQSVVCWECAMDRDALWVSDSVNAESRQCTGNVDVTTSRSLVVFDSDGVTCGHLPNHRHWCRVLIPVPVVQLKLPFILHS